MLITRSKLIVAFIQLVLCAVVLVSSNTTFNVGISVLNFAFGIYFVYLCKGKLLTFVVIFASLSYILHMGWLIAVNLFGFKSSFLAFPQDVVNLSILLCMLCHTAFFWGGGVSDNKYIRIKPLINFNQRIDRITIVNLGILCCILGVYSKFNIMIKQLMTAQIYGYSVSSAEEIGINGILVQFYYVGVLLLIAGLKEKKNFARIILLIAIIFEIVSMLSGSRIYSISMILAIVYVYFAFVQRPKKSMIVFGVLAAYILSMAMSVIASIRTLGGFDIENVLFAAESSNDNPILMFMAEMGGTMIDVIYGITDFPGHTSYGLGMTYIDSILSVIPYYENNIANEVNLYFIKGFKSYEYLGGSWIGEAYYNFGWLSCLFCFFVGKVLGKFDSIFDRCAMTGDYTGALILLSFLFYIIGYARDYFYKFVTAIQVCLVVLVLGYVLNIILSKLIKEARCHNNTLSFDRN